MDVITTGFAWYFVFVFSLTFHEAAHAWAAHKLGDDTAYDGGQVTMNPKVHMQREPFGTIVVPLISYVMGGWMLGWASCPYDPRWAMEYPKRSALMSLAGPVSNFIIVAISGVIIRLGISFGAFHPPFSVSFTKVVSATSPGFMTSFALLLSIFFSLNLLLGVFNLLPVPPLDGSGILPLFMKEDTARGYMELVSNPTLAIVGLYLSWQAFDMIFGPIHLFFINLLYPGMSYG